MAFLYFYDKKVDIAVIETWLGGRLDSTNVITPLVSVITNVGIEHTEYLGNTIKKIAIEKSGIIKNNVPVVTAAEGIALATIKKVSKKNNSKLNIVNNKKINYKLGLKGKFQIKNASIAIRTLEILKNNKIHENRRFSGHRKSKGFSREIKITNANIINGLTDVKWQGRFEFLNKNTLLDCAHNPDGFKILLNELKYIKYDKLILIIGFSDDKDVKAISKIIKADKIILTKSNNFKALNPKTIKKYFKNSVIMNDPKKALSYAKKYSSTKDLILITGSIFLVGELI